jgi:hypothetical protein
MGDAHAAGDFEMTQRLTTRNPMITWERGIELACILSVAAVMSACGEDAATPTTSAPTDDTAQAYEVLSQSLKACEDQQDACTTAAMSDAAKLAACDSDAAGCKHNTEAAAEHARDNLSRDTNACWKKCRHDDDDAGISSDDDAGTDDMHGCIEHHAPRLPSCVLGFLGCLHDAGLRKGDASREEIVACIQEADSCFRDEFTARRDAERGHRGHGRGGDQAGTGAAGSPPVTNPAAGGAGGATGSAGAAGSAGKGGDKPGFPFPTPGGDRGGRGPKK